VRRSLAASSVSESGKESANRRIPRSTDGLPGAPRRSP
jgi:hypothetical protein